MDDLFKMGLMVCVFFLACGIVIGYLVGGYAMDNRWNDFYDTVKNKTNCYNNNILPKLNDSFSLKKINISSDWRKQNE